MRPVLPPLDRRLRQKLMLCRGVSYLTSLPVAVDEILQYWRHRKKSLCDRRRYMHYWAFSKHVLFNKGEPFSIIEHNKGSLSPTDITQQRRAILQQTEHNKGGPFSNRQNTTKAGLSPTDRTQQKRAILQQTEHNKSGPFSNRYNLTKAGHSPTDRTQQRRAILQQKERNKGGPFSNR